MTEAEKDPFQLLAEALERATPLKDRDIRVAAGKDRLLDRRGPPSIVLFPVDGTIKSANDASAIRDIDQGVLFSLWGESLQGAWLLLRRLVQALELQQDQAPVDQTPPSFFWQAVSVKWDDEPDQKGEGQLVELVCNVRLSLDRVAPSEGRVDEVSLTRVPPT